MPEPTAVNSRRIYELTSPLELAGLVDSDVEAWNAAKEQLRDGQILGWMRATGFDDYVEAWEQNSREYSSDEDAALEAFLHILSPDLPAPEIVVEPKEVHITKTRLGQIERASITVSSSGRGHLFGGVELDPTPRGVSIEQSEVAANILLGQTSTVMITMGEDCTSSSRSAIRLITNAGTTSVPLSFKYEVALRHALLDSIQNKGLAFFSIILCVCSIEGIIVSFYYHKGPFYTPILIFVICGCAYAICTHYAGFFGPKLSIFLSIAAVPIVLIALSVAVGLGIVYLILYVWMEAT